jgi:replication factor C small subunit
VDLWIEKYRPKKIDDYVFIDPEQKKTVQQWIKNGSTPNLILTGAPGVGKTTAALMLMEELGVHDADIKFINASKDNGIDYIRGVIDNFCNTMPYGDFRYVILDESDYLSINSQAALRNPMEQYSDTARFILTANYQNKIIPALYSRCHHFHIDKMDKIEFKCRIASILINEGVTFDINSSGTDQLDNFIDASYPDLRKCINSCQLNVRDGVLITPTKTLSKNDDFKISAIGLFRERKYKEARELICKQISDSEYEDFYRFMYENLELWAETEQQKQQVILAIRDGLVKDTSVADREINLSATLVNLEIIAMENL